MLKLTQQEQAWLDDYRKAIEEKHPGVVREMLLYGSKLVGKLTPKVIWMCFSSSGTRAGVSKGNYAASVTCSPQVLPSSIAYTQEEWESRRKSGSTFRQAVERDAVRVV
jgi:hypothetical protein